jgi:hypothetical protein
VLRAAVAVALVALVLAGEAGALTCPQVTMRKRIDAADAAFVGTLVASRPVGAGQRVYRFDVAQPVKGPVGSEIDVRAPRLVYSNDKPVPPGTDVGVLALLDGATFTTTSCGITNPALLLAEASEPKGGWIKLVIGATILAAVVVFSLRRLRRRAAVTD